MFQSPKRLDPELSISRVRMLTEDREDLGRDDSLRCQ